jgi:hypothetical protein
MNSTLRLASRARWAIEGATRELDISRKWQLHVSEPFAARLCGRTRFARSNDLQVIGQPALLRTYHLNSREKYDYPKRRAAHFIRYRA